MQTRRRFLLSGVAAASLSLYFPPSSAFWRASSGVPSFSGNPYASVSSIDTSGGIAASRTAGNTPCFVQVSASAINAAGTVPNGTFLPFEDLYFFWNFGDSSGAEIFADPTKGVSRNANSQQFGPEAAYCYRSSGTYKITLTVVGANGSGGFISATVQQTVTVTDFNSLASITHWYFDSAATGANNGSSPTDAFTLMTGGTPDMTNLVAKLHTGNPAALHFKRGSSWNIDTTTTGIADSFDILGPFYVQSQHTRVDSNMPNGTPYGSGANPQFILNGTGLTLTGSQSGNTLSITANTGGRPMVIGQGVKSFKTGQGGGSGTIIDNSLANPDGTGTYTINHSFSVSSEPMAGGLTIIGSVVPLGGSTGTLNITDNSFGFKLAVGTTLFDGNYGHVPSPTQITDNSSANSDGTGNYTVNRNLNTQATVTGSITGTTLNISSTSLGAKLLIGTVITGAGFTSTIVTDNSAASSNGSGNYTIKDSLSIASETLTVAQQPMFVQYPSGVMTDNGGGSSPITRADFVMSKIDFLRQGTASSPFIVISQGQNATANVSDFYFDNCNLVSNVTAVSYNNEVVFQANQSAGAIGSLSNAGWWGGSITSMPSDLSGGIGILYVVPSWCFTVGATLTGGGSNDVLDHHIYPDVFRHAYFRWLNFGMAGAGHPRSFCINCNWDDNTGLLGGNTQFWHLVECNATGTIFWHDAGNGNNSFSATQFSNFVSESNNIHDLTGSSLILFSCAQTYTARNNNIYNNNNGAYFAPDATQLKTHLESKHYGNKIYRNGGSANGGIFDFRTSGWTVPQFLKGNIIFDNSSSPLCNWVVEADQVAAGSIWDDNQYWAPNASGGMGISGVFNKDNTTGRAFGPLGTAGTWQNGGLDPNSIVQNPNWSNPANGIF